MVILEFGRDQTILTSSIVKSNFPFSQPISLVCTRIIYQIRMEVNTWGYRYIFLFQVYIDCAAFSILYPIILGANFAVETSSASYILLAGNDVFYTNRTIVCATNETSQQILWTYKMSQGEVYVDITSDADWNSINGVSTLEITTSRQGYYKCEIPEVGIRYTAAIFNPDFTKG